VSNPMLKCFRTWWIRSQRVGEKEIELERLGLEYHIDLGRMIAHDGWGMGRIYQVYREVFGIDGFDYSLEIDADELRADAERRGVSVWAERLERLKRAIALYTAFPSDMCGAPDSWVRAMIEQGQLIERSYPDDPLRRARQAERDERLAKLKVEALEKLVNPPWWCTRWTSGASSCLAARGSTGCSLACSADANRFDRAHSRGAN
jgi:hypothetical protein